MLRSINPATGQLQYQVDTLDDKQLEQRIDAAQTAFQDWVGAGFDGRGQVLRKMAALMRDEVETLAALMTDEMGKPVGEARGEVEKAAWCAGRSEERRGGE